MARLLPALASPADFYRERGRPLADWEPALRTIAARHDLPAGPFTRFDRGESPVFALGDDFVIKLPPALMAPFFRRETDALTLLNGYPAPPTPRLLAQGTIEDWSYLVMTRIAGRPLSAVWPEVPADQRPALARAYGESLAAVHALPAPVPRAGRTGRSFATTA